MNFHERLHAELAAKRDQIAQLFIVQCGDDQQETVGVVSAGFPDLPGIEDEVLAKDRESD